MTPPEDRAPLKVVVVADSKIPTPPVGYGGAERIAHLIAQGLQERGHEVTLMAAKGSASPGRLVTYPWAGRRHRAWRALCKLVFFLLSLREAARRPDVVIALCRPDYLAVFQRLGVPIVYNFQNPVEAKELGPLKRRMRGPYRFVGISRAQVGGAFDKDWTIIFNAVDVDALQPLEAAPRDYLAFLGRLTRNKGVDVAIEVARQTGLALKIAGTRMPDPPDAEYFDNVVAPALGAGVEWVGEVNDQQKVGFLGRALALLVPIRWSEPFGIVVAEALACGTPVIATPCGSMPELVRDGENGFLVADADDMARAVGRLSELSAAACRRDAVTRFSADGLADAYEALARQVAGERNARRAAARRELT